MLTVCALFYGDFPDLAARLLLPLSQADTSVLDFRFATNAASPETLKRVQTAAARHKALVHINPENRLKYPVMRELIYGDGKAIPPITTPYVMWFDDDSYIKQPSKFFQKTLQQFEQSGADLFGHIWTQNLVGQQDVWVRDQPWYIGQPEVGPGYKVSFATGGWWLAKLAALQSLNYPWPELEHRGGDVMLSLALRQQGFKLKNFTDGLAINADAHGRHGKSKRRGVDQPYIGSNYSPPDKPTGRPYSLWG